MHSQFTLKVPLLWVMKGSYFGFGNPQQQVDMHARSKKHFHCLIICIYFLPYLLNDSQTISLTIHFSKNLICVTLICGDWSDWSHFHFIMPVISGVVVPGEVGILLIYAPFFFYGLAKDERPVS